MAYPLIGESTNLSTGISGLFIYGNEVTTGIFFSTVMVAIYFIILLGYYKINNKDLAGGFASAGFVTFVIGLLFRLGGYINMQVFTIVIGVAIISVIPLLLHRTNI